MKSTIFLIIALLASSTINPALAYNNGTGTKNKANTKDREIIREQDKTLELIPQDTPLMPQTAERARNAIPVKQIQLDTQGRAILKGSIKGLNTDIYRFRGQQGDIIRILRKNADNMEFAIFRPDIGLRFGDYQILPQTGIYELRIVNNRKHSAHDKTPRAYNVTFTLIWGK